MVEVRGWHLGPKWQPESVAEGYNHEVETQLLEQARWWENGYRLFDISAASAQTKSGFSQPAAESNCFFMSRALFDQIGGFDERYAEAGGGLVNLDFYSRAADAAESRLDDSRRRNISSGAWRRGDQSFFGGIARRQLAGARNPRGCAVRMPAVDSAKFILAGHMPKEFQAWLNRMTSTRSPKR